MRTKPFNLEISDLAETDLKNAYQFYAEESTRVAESFFKQINSSLEVIKKNPRSFPCAYKSVQKFVVKNSHL